MPGKRVILAAVLGLAGGIALMYFGLRDQAEQATVEFRIDIKCFFNQMEVRNFSCHFYERDLEQAS